MIHSDCTEQVLKYAGRDLSLLFISLCTSPRTSKGSKASSMSSGWFPSGLASRRTKHSEQGFGLVRVGEVRIVEHDEDLEDYTVIGADRVALAGYFNCGW